AIPSPPPHRPLHSFPTRRSSDLFLPSAAFAQNGNRLAYLDEVDPYYPHKSFPKLITPQWVGEPGVEAVVILAIDDMRDPKKYERSEEHTSELQSPYELVCRLLLE